MLKFVLKTQGLAGLGRAPVLVGIALMERGMSSLDAILHIRNNRFFFFNSHSNLFYSISAMFLLFW